MGRVRPSIDTFLRMAGTLANVDAVDLPQFLADRCVDFVDAEAAGVLIADPAGLLRTSAVTSDDAEAVEVLEASAADGPALEAYRSGTEVAVEDLGEGARWPSFAAAAAGRGFARAYCFPLEGPKQVVGVLALLQTAGRPPLGEAASAFARALAVLAAIRLVHDRAQQDAERHAAQLQRALDSRIVIEQAKGMLAERLALSPDEAFDRMRAYARHGNLRLREVAGAVVEGRLPTV